MEEKKGKSILLLLSASFPIMFVYGACFSVINESQSWVAALSHLRLAFCLISLANILIVFGVETAACLRGAFITSVDVIDIGAGKVVRACLACLAIAATDGYVLYVGEFSMFFRLKLLSGGYIGFSFFCASAVFMAAAPTLVLVELIRLRWEARRDGR